MIELDVASAKLDVASAGLDVAPVKGHVTPAELDVAPVFFTLKKAGGNTPKTHKALYLRAFCGCGVCQGRDVKIFLSGLDRLADSRKVVAVNVNYDC